MNSYLSYADETTPKGRAGLRDLQAEDIERIVEYWHFSGTEHLDLLGIDRSLLGGPDDTYERFRAAIPTGDPGQLSVALSITLDGIPVGYTLLNQFEREVNYSHWHLMEKSVRKSGLSALLYPHRIKAYFDLTHMTRLIHLTRTRNIGVNRMLDKYVPLAETRHFDHPPGGFGEAGEFHIRYVLREDIPQIMKRGHFVKQSIIHGVRGKP